ncbi:hypothetical protein IH979_00120 [Patescibacteria group bacterium]|nr:hypothetical protein [Patescibacteria group bacterium]
MKRDILSLIIVFALVSLLGAYFLFAPKASEITYRPLDVAGGSITVEDQEQFDQVILSAELSEPGWITIHEALSTAGGTAAPAEIVGVSDYLEPGTYQDLVIILDQEMLSSFKYITLLHVDNGNQTFEAQEDFPAAVNGVVVRPDFIAIGPKEESSSEAGEELDVEE